MSVTMEMAEIIIFLINTAYCFYEVLNFADQKYFVL